MSFCPTVSAAAHPGAFIAGPTRAPKRVLLIAYQFPPVGGAGVQRPVKFVKYLREHGWLPSVLTVANPSVPLYDSSLAKDVPADTVIRRAKTLEPSYALKQVVLGGDAARPSLLHRVARLGKSLVRRCANLVLQPDPQVLWLPHAVREGRRLLAEVKHDAIIATGPPFSAFLIGARLSRHSGLPLVLDYRDEWDLSNAYLENRRQGALVRAFQGWIQRRLIRSAQALVATTRSSSEALARLRDRAGGTARATWIYNGFDPDDFAGPVPSAARDTFRLVYTGTLWHLTSAAPLVAAVRKFAAESPDLAARLEVVVAGRRTGEEDQLLDGLTQLPCRLVRHSYLDHAEALGLVRSAGGLCLLMADQPGTDRWVPAKTFEYMAAGRPILAVAPRGEIWDILRDYPGAALFTPDDVAGIAAWLRRLAAGSRDDKPLVSSCPHDRRTQAGQLAALLDSLTASDEGRTE